MSASAISVNTPPRPAVHFYDTRRDDLQQLGNALRGGNLAGAESAFADIVTLGQDGPFADKKPFLNPTREKDFAAIGADLQSGNLAGAQQAFAALEATFHKGGSGSPIHIGSAPSSGSPTSGSGPSVSILA
jgi:hypothetical protein